MTLLALPAPELPGDVLPREFSDLERADTAYLLPEALELMVDAGGRPAFLLMSYVDDAGSTEFSGGVLHARLRLAGAPPSSAARNLPVVFRQARSRLLRRSALAGGSQTVGAWTDLVAHSDELVAAGVRLGEADAAIAAALLRGEAAVVDVEVEASFDGIVRPVRWLATAQRERLRAALAGTLGAAARSWTEVQAAFLSLPEGDGSPLEFRPLDDGLAPPPRERLLAELAPRAVSTLFSGDDTRGWTLLPAAPDAPSEVSWDLSTLRTELRRVRYNWSVSAFFSALAAQDREACFPVVRDVSLLDTQTVHVVSGLPPDLLRQADVEFRWTSPTGSVDRKTLSLTPTSPAARFDLVRNTLHELDLAWKVTASLVPPADTTWPRLVVLDFRSAPGPVVQVDPEALGLRLVRVVAVPDVFEVASALVVLGRAEGGTDVQERLTAERPAAWLVLKGPPAGAEVIVEVVASPPEGSSAAPVTVLQASTVGGEVVVAADRLRVLAPEVLRVSVSPALAFAAVEIEQAGPLGLRTVEPGRPLTWLLRRADVFDELRYRWRARFVGRDPAGNTLPMVVGEWTDATGATLHVGPV